MSKRKDSRLVYTTDPEEAKRLREEGKMPEASDADPSKQTLRVTLDRKNRRGKTVTLISGFELTPDSLGKLAKKLKKSCGTGGSASGSEIEIQGDHVEKVTSILRKLGYDVS